MWADDELWGGVEARAGAGPTFSNDPELVYVRTRLRSRPIGGSIGDVRRVARELGTGGVAGTLVWIPHNRREALPLEVLERWLALEPVFATETGSVHSFRPRASEASDP
jgi:hypothetical protein